jgi:hypothetical protein
MTANLHVTKIKGNLAYYQGAVNSTNKKRLVYPAIGPDVYQINEDFVYSAQVAATNFSAGWTITLVGASTIRLEDAVGGAMLITTTALENDGVNAQIIGESFELTSDQHLFFGLYGIKIDNATQSDFFAGLAITDTDILGGVTDRIGFEKLDGAVDLKFMLEKDSVETLTDSAIDVANATAFDIEMYWDGDAGTVEFFVNGVSVGSPVTTNLPNDEFLRPTIQFLTGEAVAHTFQADKLVIIAIGR